LPPHIRGRLPENSKSYTLNFGKKKNPYQNPYLRRNRVRTYNYSCCHRYSNSLDMIRKGLKMDSIILFFIFFLGLTPVSAILYPVMWMYNLVKYCQLNSYSYTYPRHPEERKKLILTCQKAVKYRVTILKVIFFTFLAIFIASSYLAYSQNFMMISSEYTYIIAVMSLC
jgi:hypothetical protein